MDRTPHGALPQYRAGLTPLGTGVWVWMQPNGDWGETNAGLVVGGDASLLVDTLWETRLAAGLLDAVGSRTPRSPLATVVNTHRDGDHWWGNAALPAEAEIWASAACAAEMAVEPPPSSLHRLACVARLGACLPGRAGDLPRYTDAMLRPFSFRGVRTRLPDRTFTGEHTLDAGGRAVRLIEVGPAHTAGDAVAHVPDAGVVFAGDILFAGSTPIVWHGPIAGWLAALDRLLACDAEVYVPGHGPLCGPTEVRALRGYWTWLVAAADAQHHRGRTATEALRELVRDPDFAPYRGWLAPERLAINVLARYRELAGEPPAATTAVARARLFARVAATRRLLAD
jgi:glyoxylase-like metal-dependent hydrolase (beta-lactamase superfamily II)